MPTLSYILCSRNDQFCGPALDRLDRTLVALSFLPTNHEVIVVDWGSEKPISENIEKVKEERYLYIPPSVTSQFDTPFSEVHALNVALRYAKGDWICRLDQDVYPGLGFSQWFNTNARVLVNSPAFMSLRRDLDADGKDTGIWRKWSADSKHFWCGSVGCLLAPRQDWLNLRGYDENLIYRNHMEHDLAIRFKKTCGLVNLGPLLSPTCDFYHQHHEECSDRKHNPWTEPEFLEENLNVLAPNDENWGLRKFWDQITEVSI